MGGSCTSACESRRLACTRAAAPKKWFNAPKPFAGKGKTELVAAYYQWRLWNAVKGDRYKGGNILEKATRNSASSPHGEASEEEESEE